MGAGDNLMATGMARGAADRGRLIAFGDGRRIRWDHHSEEIFANNPNIAEPGSEHRKGIKWIRYYKGNRIYNHQDGDRWIWNYDFKATPGEMYFTDKERAEGARHGRGFVLIESNVPLWKPAARNKDWGRRNYQQVADALRRDGHRVMQFVYRGSTLLRGVGEIRTKSFRDALAVLANAALYVGPEGGLHHGAAAVNVPGVVLFGGFIPPKVTGYDAHTNLTGNAESCGSLKPCQHCRDAMAKIGADEVHSAALAHFRKVAA